MPCLMDTKVIGNEEAVCPLSIEKNDVCPKIEREDDVEMEEDDTSRSPPMLCEETGDEERVVKEEAEEEGKGLEEEEDDEEEEEKRRKRAEKSARRRELRKEKKLNGARRDDPNAPKRNRSAYVHFIIDRRADLIKDKAIPLRDINLMLATEWQKLPAEEKMRYQKLAEDEKREYLRKSEEYKKTKEFAQFQKLKSSVSKNRKRKIEEEEELKVTGKMPPDSAFCPLFNEHKPSTSDATFVGNVFSAEFVNYNKAREAYRRQLQKERATIEHELNAIANHDMEQQIKDQSKSLDELTDQIEHIMKTMRGALGGVRAAQDHLENISSLTDWLRTASKTPATRKSVKEAILKRGK